MFQLTDLRRRGSMVLERKSLSKTREVDMRHVFNSRNTSPSNPAVLRPGEVIYGNVVNGIENRSTSGKFRPCVIIEVPPFGGLTVAGLTSQGITKKDELRVELTDNQGWRTTGRSFLFGRRLTRLARIDVGDHGGWLSERDAAIVATVYGLDADWMTMSCQEVA